MPWLGQCDPSCQKTNIHNNVNILTCQNTNPLCNSSCWTGWMGCHPNMFFMGIYSFLFNSPTTFNKTQEKNLWARQTRPMGNMKNLISNKPMSVENTSPEYGRNTFNNPILVVPVCVHLPLGAWAAVSAYAGGLAPRELVTCWLHICWALARHTFCKPWRESFIQKIS